MAVIPSDPSPLWPMVNAIFNGLSFILLCIGWIAIRKQQQKTHIICMISALSSSAIFLASYLLYHYQTGSTAFQGEGILRTVYFSILLSHTILAVVMLPLIIKMLLHAKKKNWEKHRRLGKITMPIWIYVSFTGVVVYWMLYRMPL